MLFNDGTLTENIA